MKNRLTVLAVITAIITLSFTFVSSDKAQYNTIDSERSTLNSQQEGLLAEDPF